jgi:hypothetical protein
MCSAALLPAGRAAAQRDAGVGAVCSVGHTATERLPKPVLPPRLLSEEDI